MIKFRMPLLAVRDVEISKKFYHDLFDQEVVLDLGGKRDVFRRLFRSAGF